MRSSAQVDDRRAELASEPAQAPGAGHAGAGHARTDLFHPAVAAWFAGAFRAPSPAQADAWPAIKARRHTLIAAPTGSGKTLAAFLAAIDDLVRQGLDGALPDAVQVVYVSPLKALSNDIHRNLEAPLEGIRQRARAERVCRRRHSHAGSDRRHRGQRARPHAPQPAAHPRHDARVALRAARLRSPDAGCWRRRERSSSTRSMRSRANKRGAHLALSLERLSALCGDRLQRIGLSATQNPIREVANLLIGANGSGDPAAEVAIVDSGHQRLRDLAIETPDFAARSGDVQRSLEPGLPTARRPHPRAQDDARLRQHPPHERTSRARAHRPARRGRGRHPSRQHGQGAAARGRAAAEARRVESDDRHRLARARHRHRRRRPRLPARLAALDRDVSAAGRPLGPRDRRHAQGAALSPFARRSDRMRGAPRQRPARRARPARHSRSSARRPRPADRRRGRGAGLEGDGALRPPAARLALPESHARRTSTPLSAPLPRGSPPASAGAGR